MSTYKIVVARYNEDISWLESEKNNLCIYNKGTPINIDNQIFLRNVGRESETYLHYIITNYENLPDVVVFTQARIADHLGSNDVNHLLKMKDDAIINTKSTPHIHHDDRYWNIKDNKFYLHDNYKNNNRISFLQWFEENIKMPFPMPTYVYSFGIFAVKKELILANKIDYYKSLILQVNHHVNPSEGHFFERSWFYIFHQVK
jgi:hypothetical protein